MIPFTAAQHAAIADLCRQFHVERIEVFGSATRADFDEKTSDIDLIVHFQNESGQGLLHRYWALTEELERLLGRPMELLTERMIRNPYFRAAVDQERQTIMPDNPKKLFADVVEQSGASSMLFPKNSTRDFGATLHRDDRHPCGKRAVAVTQRSTYNRQPLLRTPPLNPQPSTLNFF